MPIVYVVQDSPGKNLIPAQEFGELRVMLSYNDSKKSTDFICNKLIKILADMESDDCLLLIGNPLFIGLACAIASNNLIKFHVLIWERDRYKYRKESVVL